MQNEHHEAVRVREEYAGSYTLLLGCLGCGCPVGTLPILLLPINKKKSEQINSPCLYDLHISSLRQADRGDIELEIRQPVYDRTATRRLHFCLCLGQAHLFTGSSPMAIHDRPIPSDHTSFAPVWRHPVAAHLLSKNPCRQVPDCRASCAVRGGFGCHQTR